MDGLPNLWDIPKGQMHPELHLHTKKRERKEQTKTREGVMSENFSNLAQTVNL